MILKNKNIIVTGGASGIGRELVIFLCKKQNNVIFIDKDKNCANNLLNSLKSYSSYFFECDISDDKNLKQTISNITNKFKKIDILINNAGFQNIGEFATTEFKSVLQTNLIGTMQITQNFLPFMNNNSSILNVLSVHAFIPRCNKIAYDVSKAGLLMFTKELALEVADQNITVNSISIGACKTPMNNEWLNDKQKVQKVTQKIPMKKIPQAKEVAKNIINILQNFSDKTTGSNFVIDQGRSLKG